MSITLSTGAFTQQAGLVSPLNSRFFLAHAHIRALRGSLQEGERLG